MALLNHNGRGHIWDDELVNFCAVVPSTVAVSETSTTTLRIRAGRMNPTHSTDPSQPTEPTPEVWFYVRDDDGNRISLIDENIVRLVPDAQSLRGSNPIIEHDDPIMKDMVAAIVVEIEIAPPEGFDGVAGNADDPDPLIDIVGLWDIEIKTENLRADVSGDPDWQWASPSDMPEGQAHPAPGTVTDYDLTWSACAAESRHAETVEGHHPGASAPRSGDRQICDARRVSCYAGREIRRGGATGFRFAAA